MYIEVSPLQRIVAKNLKTAGITINGDKPYDIKIHNPDFYKKIILHQSIGAGESYMDGEWDCDQLDELFYRICLNRVDAAFYSNIKLFLIRLKNSMLNQQSRSKAYEVAKVHYNLGSKLFEYMLGPSLAYTCGYWKSAKSLDEAEFDKYELVCKKLMLTPGDKVLEIGCGMGGLAKYMAEQYGCEVVALDIADNQVKYAVKYCENLPVKVYLADYRDVDIYNPHHVKFDKIVSVGVLEHVGYKNYDRLLEICRTSIKEDGIFLLHTIGGNVSTNFCDPWINKYIFPNGMLPSLKQIGKTFEGRFVLEDLQNFGSYYDNTLMAWHKNLNDHWPDLQSQYDERFHRMMNYYLLSCAGAFRARAMQLWQFVLTPNGIANGYKPFI